MEPVPETELPRAASPVELSERISSIDVLRGFALLGILLMNVTATGLYFGAYNNPAVAEASRHRILAVWACSMSLQGGRCDACSRWYSAPAQFC